MADRYWVGGTASWDGTAGTKWAATSGGAGGESVPTSADDVFFDANSSGTCTVASGNTGAKSVTCTGFAGGLTISSSLRVYGNFTLDSGMTYTHSASLLSLEGTGTVTTAGKLMGTTAIGFDNDTITVTLGDAWTSVSSPFPRSIFFVAGTFNTNNFNLTTNGLALGSPDDYNKTINFGSSTITISGTVGSSVFTSTKLTFNAGTSQFNLTASNATFSGGGKAFYNVAFTSTAAGTRTITGANSFNQISSVSTVAHTIQFSDNQNTIGTWLVTGSAGNVVTIKSSSAGTRRNFTLTNITTNIDYLNVTDIGELSGNKFAVGFNSTNGGNNSNVYFAESPPGGAFFLF